MNPKYGAMLFMSRELVEGYIDEHNVHISEEENIRTFLQKEYGIKEIVGGPEMKIWIQFWEQSKDVFYVKVRSGFQYPGLLVVPEASEYPLLQPTK